MVGLVYSYVRTKGKFDILDLISSVLGSLVSVTGNRNSDEMENINKWIRTIYCLLFSSVSINAFTFFSLINRRMCTLPTLGKVIY